ncbi:LSM domain-containing protein [Sarocladium implicatum]|nr:LSM domain-containing protein [Sarocladium implicatum]
MDGDIATSSPPSFTSRRSSTQQFKRAPDHAPHIYAMLPLGLLNAAQGHPMLVELKNGETLNGHLITCDTWMNLTLKEVVQTSPDGDKFVRLPEVYVKGNNIKYLRVPDEIIDIVTENQKNQQGNFRGGRGGGGQSRGDHGGRGGGDRGRGGRGGGRGGRGRGRGQ